MQPFWLDGLYQRFEGLACAWAGRHLPPSGGPPACEIRTLASGPSAKNGHWQKPPLSAGLRDAAVLAPSARARTASAAVMACEARPRRRRTGPPGQTRHPIRSQDQTLGIAARQRLARGPVTMLSSHSPPAVRTIAGPAGMSA